MQYGMIILTSMKLDSLLTISLNASSRVCNQLQNALGVQTVQPRPMQNVFNQQVSMHHNLTQIRP